MSQSLKKEIDALVEEALQELGGVDHRRQGTGPVTAGFAQEPISSAAQDVYTTYAINAHQHLGKSLEELSLVIDELEGRGHDAGDLVLVRDQIAQALEKFNQILQGPEGELAEGKSKRKCRCPDGSKSANCCKKGWVQKMKKGPIAGKLTYQHGIANPSTATTSMGSGGSGGNGGGTSA